MGDKASIDTPYPAWIIWVCIAVMLVSALATASFPSVAMVGLLIGSVDVPGFVAHVVADTLGLPNRSSAEVRALSGGMAINGFWSAGISAVLVYLFAGDQPPVFSSSSAASSWIPNASTPLRVSFSPHPLISTTWSDTTAPLVASTSCAFR